MHSLFCSPMYRSWPSCSQKEPGARGVPHTLPRFGSLSTVCLPWGTGLPLRKSKASLSGVWAMRKGGPQCTYLESTRCAFEWLSVSRVGLPVDCQYPASGLLWRGRWGLSPGPGVPVWVRSCVWLPVSSSCSHSLLALTDLPHGAFPLM